MQQAKLTIDQYRELIESGDSRDPLIFLEAVMNGQDPRKVSELYALVMDIEDLSNGNPSRDDWNELVDFVVRNHKYTAVSLSESTSAANTLASYLHAKRKQIERGDIGSIGGGKTEPLTDEEIERFKRKFNSEF